MENKASLMLKNSLSLLFYIVTFLCCFNIFSAYASNVTTEFEEIDNDKISDDFFQTPVNLPPAFQIKAILEQNKNNSISNILLLGQYFDAKYPAERIDMNFEDDIRQIFPDLSKQQLYDYTSNIRLAIKTYRFAKQKYTEIKQQLIAPKEPPLIVDEKDYDLPQNHPYINADEGKFALVYDFKKVLSYSSDPKEIEAYKAYFERQVEKKKQKTDFDKFKLMFSKIEFSKLFQYGVTIPNPFVGNAGSGQWVEDSNGIKAKIISSVSEIYQTKEILAAAYLFIPSHRIMAATTLYGKAIRPQIKLTDMQNIESYEVLWPMPATLINQYMVGAYVGDFAVPIKLKLIDPDKPVNLKAEITFDDCDDQLTCSSQTLSPELFIDTGEEESFSSMRNFITQSYTHLPQKHHKNISLEDFSIQFNQDHSAVSRINLVFDFKGDFKSFSLFLSTPENVNFMTPKYIVVDNKIFASIIPAPDSPSLSLINTPLSYMVQFNIFDKLSGTLDLNKASKESKETSLFHIAFLSFFTGLLFILSPVGLTIFALWTQRFQNKVQPFKKRIFNTWPLFILMSVSVIWTVLQYREISNIWTAQFSNGAMLFTFLSSLLFYLFYTRTEIVLFPQHPIFRAFCFDLFLILSLIFSDTWLLNRLVFSLDDMAAHLTAAFMICTGLLLPYLLYRPAQNPKIQKLIFLSGNIMAKLIVAYILILFFFQTSWIAFFKIVLILTFIYLMLIFIFSFLNSLNNIKAETKDKNITEWILFFVSFLIFAICTKSTNRILSEDFVQSHDSQPLAQVEQETPDTQLSSQPLAQVDQLLQNGQNILVSVSADWCLTCRINQLTAFNQTELKRLNNAYPLTYIRIDATKPTPEITAFLKKYKTNSVPLTVFYNPILDQGLVFPSLIKDRELIGLVKKYYI